MGPFGQESFSKAVGILVVSGWVFFFFCVFFFLSNFMVEIKYVRLFIG